MQSKKLTDEEKQKLIQEILDAEEKYGCTAGDVKKPLPKISEKRKMKQIKDYIL